MEYQKLNERKKLLDIEEDIRPAVRQKINFSYLNSDIEDLLLPNLDKFVFVNCPSCNSEKTDFYYQKGYFKFSLCNECETVFVNPRPAKDCLDEFYEKSIFFQGFMESLTENESGRIKHIFEPRAKMIISFLRNQKVDKGDLLDVGCSVGTMLSIFRDNSEFDLYGLDPSQIAIDHCKRRGFDIFPTTIEDFDSEKKFDVVLSFETIEHLFWPRDFVEKIAKVIRPGGYLVFSTPNYHGFDIAILGKHYKRVMAPFHLNYFNIGNIDKILNPFELKIIKKMTPGILDIINVKKQIEEGVAPEVSDFIKYLLFQTSIETQNKFQDFLQENCLSSHMLVFAKKQ